MSLFQPRKDVFQGNFPSPEQYIFSELVYMTDRLLPYVCQNLFPHDLPCLKFYKVRRKNNEKDFNREKDNQIANILMNLWIFYVNLWEIVTSIRIFV